MCLYIFELYTCIQGVRNIFNNFLRGSTTFSQTRNLNILQFNSGINNMFGKSFYKNVLYQHEREITIQKLNVSSSQI